MTYVPQNLQAPEIELQSGSYLDWGAIFAGIILASAISVVLLAFGSAIGLSFSAATVSAKSYAIGAGIGAAALVYLGAGFKLYGRRLSHGSHAEAKA